MNEFAASACKFMFYENVSGETKVFFNKLDAPLYAAMVANLCSLQNSKVYEFLKLVLEGARLMKQQTKKGLEMAVKIESYLKTKPNQLI